MALPLLVLLISASNVANLVLSRGVSRAGELSVRVALGASRPQLIREQLIEAVIVASWAASWGYSSLMASSDGRCP